MSGFDSLDKKMKILVVDDFATMRRIVKMCLKQLGFDNVTDAVDGEDAWNKLNSSEEFQMIISDWNMPKMMGIDLLKNVRGDDRFKTVPFLMVTAECNQANVMEAVKAGVSNYIVKPFTSETLEEKFRLIYDK